MSAQSKQSASYSEYGTAYERAMKLQASGCRGIRIDKTSSGWVITYVEYTKAEEH